MKRNADYRGNDLAKWLVIQTFVIIVTAILAFLFVEFISRIIFGNSDSARTFGYALGLIFPMAIILGAVNFFLFNYTYRYFSMLAKGIERISDGDFSVRLDEGKAGPFASVYVNFNKMGSELQNVHMLRNDFINSYSHEFKTPIVSINGFAKLLLEENISDEERLRYLRIIADESDRLSDLANSTILLSMLDSQIIVTDKADYSLDEQLRECGIILAPSWSKKAITLSAELDEVIFNGNAQSMQHLWLNILSNAIKYTPNGGKIAVTLTTDKNTAVVKIADTGIGMDKETISRIFEKYYQREALENRQGLGLGLSIAKRIVELCDGKIEVESEKGIGSIFTVTLPLT